MIGVKSVFNISRCFYLISVSEDALASFDRRGAGLRDGFDSALNDIVYVGYLKLDQSRNLLSRRVLRLDDPFVQICHMISGGLPRDLIRHARTILNYVEQTQKRIADIKSVVEELAAKDVYARLRAASVALRATRELLETAALQTALAKLPDRASQSATNFALQEFRKHPAGLEPLRASEDGRSLLRVGDETAIYYESILLMRKVGSLISTKAGWMLATEQDLAEVVARLRQSLERGVPLAQGQLNHARSISEKAAPAIPRRRLCADGLRQAAPPNSREAAAARPLSGSRERES